MLVSINVHCVSASNSVRLVRFADEGPSFDSARKILGVVRTSPSLMLGSDILNKLNADGFCVGWGKIDCVEKLLKEFPTNTIVDKGRIVALKYGQRSVYIVDCGKHLSSVLFENYKENQ